MIFTLDQLLQYNIGDIRKIAQEMNVPQPTAGRKEEIAKRIIEVQIGTLAPSTETRGKKPNKNSILGDTGAKAEDEADETSVLRQPMPLLDDESTLTELPPTEDGRFAPAKCTDAFDGQGVLEVMQEGHGFLRVNNF